MRVLQNQKDAVRPPEELLRSTLQKLPNGTPLRSPYAEYWTYFKKFGVASVALLMLVVGGIFFGRYEFGGSQNEIAQNIQPITEPPEKENATISSKDNDAALEQDMNAVDAELSGLNMDTSSVDKSLNSQTS